MGYSKDELAIINILYSPKKNVMITPLPITAACPQRLLCSVPKVAVLERFHCINGNDKKFKRCLFVLS